ncbi:MAG TPA: serine hydrolase domain-containing protein [Thermoanaerobaculia bacterium]|nr:serine hydrolase domain-containing protein [Thermoanaerobaculia bacterium]
MVIEQFLQREIDVGSFPAAAWAVGSLQGIEHEGALGHAVAVPLRIPAIVETIFDVASLTKPLITATLILQAVAEGRIALDDRFEGFTYRSLLTHSSGLIAWLPLYAFPDPLQAIHDHGRGATGTVYSDLNFVLLWYALQRLYGDYVALAESRILKPLGVEALFRPPAPLKPRIAATEWGQRWEMRMCAERKIAFDGFRQTLIWGETHDGNSHHLGGTAGNAGLFATARAVFRIAQAFVSGDLVPRELAAERLGWDKPTPGSPATSMLSPDAFGHTGFTGTSVWIDRDRILVLLTNRVHPVAAANAMQKIRGEFHKLGALASAPAGPAASRRRG